MGMRIGQNVPGYQPAPRFVTRDGQAPDMVRGAPAEPPSAGFGENTLSTNGAALETIGRNFRAVRDVVPTIEQRLEETRDRQAEQAAAREAQAQRTERQAEALEANRAQARESARAAAREARRAQAGQDAQALREAPARPEPAQNPPAPGNPVTTARLDILA